MGTRGTAKDSPRAPMLRAQGGESPREDQEGTAGCLGLQPTELLADDAGERHGWQVDGAGSRGNVRQPERPRLDKWVHVPVLGRVQP